MVMYRASFRRGLTRLWLEATQREALTFPKAPRLELFVCYS